jgi:hypothetical protein
MYGACQSENEHIENSCKRKIIFSTNSYILRFREETCICLMRYSIFAYNITRFVLWSVGLTNVLKRWIVPSNCSDTFLCVAANSINIVSTLNPFPCTSKLSNLITRDRKHTFCSATLTCFDGARSYKNITTDNYKYKYLRLLVTKLIPPSTFAKA